eukprot:5456904-Alexandrium_andersonii.AAC.1
MPGPHGDPSASESSEPPSRNDSSMRNSPITPLSKTKSPSGPSSASKPTAAKKTRHWSTRA